MSSNVAQKLQRAIDINGKSLNTDGFMQALRELAKLNQPKVPKEAETCLQLCDRELKTSEADKPN